MTYTRNRKMYKTQSKYHNRKSGGFDSKKEKDRWYELQLLEKAGVIHGLKRQVKFELTPTVREPDTIGPRGGKKPGKVIEYSSSYIADFTYYQKDGTYIVEDCKGFRTPEYILKRKIMLYYKGIRIYET